MHCALAHDQSEDIATVSPQRHTDADLAGAARHGVGFDSINANDGEKKRDSAESAEECGAKLNDPKADASFHQINPWRDAEDWKIRIDFA